VKVCDCRLCRDEYGSSGLLDLGRPTTIDEYNDLDRIVWRLLEEDAYAANAAIRWLTAHDLFYFTTRTSTTRGLINETSGLPIFERQWTLEWCHEIEADPEAPDMVGRGMGKSTLKTKNRNIQRALCNPNIGIGIFSYQKDAAKRHGRGIMQELTINKPLVRLFPEVLYLKPKDPQDGAPLWSLDEGLVVRRTTSRQESTFGFHALKYDQLPTGLHYDVQDYDDVEDDKAVKSDDTIEDLKRAATQAAHLVTQATIPIYSFTGTPYHENGLVMARVNAFGDRARVYPGEDLSIPGDGPMGGTPVYYTREELQVRFDKMVSDDPVSGRDNYAKQICLDTRAGTGRSLNPEWLRYYEESSLELGRNGYVVICQDPSMGLINPTATWVWALLPDKRFAWVDGSRGMFTPHERLEETYRLVAKWQHISLGVQQVRIEQFGQADFVDPTKLYLSERGLFPPVYKCHNTTKTKIERIYSCWQPQLADGMVLFPKRMETTSDGRRYDLVRYFIDNELGKFPRPVTDDLLDAGALVWENHKTMEPLAFPSPPRSYRDDDDERSDRAHWATAGAW